MGLSANLFFDDGDNETLFKRISLNEEQIKGAREKKDNLLELIKPELSNSLDAPVRHWLQGSYKNHTLVRPVRKGGEFDIDVGMYILCNAEDEGLSALDCKNMNREVLKWFVSNKPESKLEKPKSNCERLSYPSAFHIDIPFYYIDDESNVCKLATQNDEWIDSDPKAFQDWFNDAVDGLSNKELAQLRRIIKYMKVWALLKGGEDDVAIPSIALTVLAVNNYHNSEYDDDSFIHTSVRAMNYVLENRYLNNPAQGGDLFGFSDDEYNVVKKKTKALKSSCEYISQLEDSFQQYILWSATFEHMFPPFVEREYEVSRKTNLPATTIPPRIRVKNLDKSNSLKSNEVTNEIRVYRGEEVCFSIENSSDYSAASEVHWVVKNQDKEAERFNDLGHIIVQGINEERSEDCSYAGTHYMECLILDGGQIKGVGAVKVKVVGFPRPVRNPPRKKHYKGR